METEEQTVTSAEATNEPVSFESALDRLNTPDEPAAPETAEAAPEGDEADQAEAPVTEPDADPDADTEAPEYLHGNARTRLRDGSEVTIGELKKAYDEAKEYRVRQPEIDARLREADQKLAQVAQHEQQAQTLIQQAKSVLQANFPPKPDFAAYERGEIDIITFTEQQAKWNVAAEKWQNLSRAEQAVKEKAEQEKAANLKQKEAAEIQAFLDKATDLKTPEAQKAFADDVVRVATKEYGATPKQVGEKLDEAWMMLMAKDAIAYRKLQADKPKALEKVKDVPPVTVQAPGRRVSAPERAAQAVSDKLAAARRSGGLSMADALSLINDI
jgi:hypothetical protein